MYIHDLRKYNNSIYHQFMKNKTFYSYQLLLFYYNIFVERLFQLSILFLLLYALFSLLPTWKEIKVLYWNEMCRIFYNDMWVKMHRTFHIFSTWPVVIWPYKWSKNENESCPRLVVQRRSSFHRPYNNF